jgi:zinc transport system substrate-binding protein
MRCSRVVAALVVTTLAGTADARDRLKVFVSVVPQAYLVERIGGERVAVSALVRPGHSPATYDPSPRQLAELGKAKIFFRIGAPFERSLLRKIATSYPGLTIVDQRERVPLLHSTGHHHHGHRHDDDADDHHIWLDPKRLKQQAGTIARTLIQIDRDAGKAYAVNLAALLEELDELDKQITALLAPHAGRAFFVYHPAYAYFADSYGLTQVAVETGGKEPSAKHLVALIEKAKKHKVRTIFVQPQFSEKSAKLVASAIGGIVAPLDPLDRDVPGGLLRMARTLTASFTSRE